MNSRKKPKKGSISACLVVYNEEKLIRRCLESIKDVVDEIIIIHDGPCKDKTLDICKEYTDKVYVGKRRGIAEPHRPETFRKASSEWILWIDADEFLSEGLKKNIRKLVQDGSVDGYKLVWGLHFGKVPFRSKAILTPNRLALFRKSKVYMKGMPAEVPKVRGKIAKSYYRIEHIPDYNSYSFETYFKKHIPWARIVARSRIKEGEADKPALYYFFLAFISPIFYFLELFLKGSFLDGWKGIQMPIVNALFYFAINWNIFKMKITKK